MAFPTPSTDPVAVSRSAIKQYESDAARRRRERAALAKATGYMMLAPGMF